jgi:hypothetical protein
MPIIWAGENGEAMINSKKTKNDMIRSKADLTTRPPQCFVVLV